MARDVKVELLRKIALFSGCSDKELRSIAAVADEVRDHAGAVLIGEGMVGREFWVIAEGSVSVSRGGVEIATRGPGEAVGEMALLDDGPRTATITATTDVVAYVVDRARFADMLRSAPDVGIGLLRVLAARLREAESTLR